MMIRREDDRVQIDLTGAEARVLLEELAHVRGGSRLPKLRQVCVGLEVTLSYMAQPQPQKQKEKKIDAPLT